MSKKKTLHNKDVFQRVNFLHQASMLMADKNTALSCYYGSLMKQVGKKAVLKL
jgi:ribonuclease P protein subunit RPR2